MPRIAPHRGNLVGAPSKAPRLVSQPPPAQPPVDPESDGEQCASEEEEDYAETVVNGGGPTSPPDGESGGHTSTADELRDACLLLDALGTEPITDSLSVLMKAKGHERIMRTLLLGMDALRKCSFPVQADHFPNYRRVVKYFGKQLAACMGARKGTRKPWMFSPNYKVLWTPDTDDAKPLQVQSCEVNLCPLDYLLFWNAQAGVDVLVEAGRIRMHLDSDEKEEHLRRSAVELYGDYYQLQRKESGRMRAVQFSNGNFYKLPDKLPVTDDAVDTFYVLNGTVPKDLISVIESQHSLCPFEKTGRMFMRMWHAPNADKPLRMRNSEMPGVSELPAFCADLKRRCNSLYVPPPKKPSKRARMVEEDADQDCALELGPAVHLLFNSMSVLEICNPTVVGLSKPNWPATLKAMLSSLSRP